MTDQETERQQTMQVELREKDLELSAAKINARAGTIYVSTAGTCFFIGSLDQGHVNIPMEVGRINEQQASFVKEALCRT